MKQALVMFSSFSDLELGWGHVASAQCIDLV